MCLNKGFPNSIRNCMSNGKQIVICKIENSVSLIVCHIFGNFYTIGTSKIFVENVQVIVRKFKTIVQTNFQI